MLPKTACREIQSLLDKLITLHLHYKYKYGAQKHKIPNLQEIRPTLGHCVSATVTTFHGLSGPFSATLRYFQNFSTILTISTNVLLLFAPEAVSETPYSMPWPAGYILDQWASRVHVGPEEPLVGGSLNIQ